ncbi:MAG: hypothetical protein ACKVTZ_17325 [Bacteroidia bacterium]
MKKNFRIHIPTPCSENWHEMLPAEKGRFCLHCQKEVVDFTQMTDFEIASFLVYNKGSVCGHIGKSQTKRSFQYVQAEFTHSPVKKYVLALLAAGFAATPMFAQNASPTPISQTLFSATSKEKQTPKEGGKTLVFGYLHYETSNKPCPFQKIHLIDYQGSWVKETQTDENGYFDFEIEEALGEGRAILSVTLNDNKIYDDTGKEIIGEHYEVDDKLVFYHKKSPTQNLLIHRGVGYDLIEDGMLEIDEAP